MRFMILYFWVIYGSTEAPRTIVATTFDSDMIKSYATAFVKENIVKKGIQGFFDPLYIEWLTLSSNKEAKIDLYTLEYVFDVFIRCKLLNTMCFVQRYPKTPTDFPTCFLTRKLSREFQKTFKNVSNGKSVGNIGELILSDEKFTNFFCDVCVKHIFEYLMTVNPIADKLIFFGTVQKLEPNKSTQPLIIVSNVKNFGYNEANLTRMTHDIDQHVKSELDVVKIVTNPLLHVIYTIYETLDPFTLEKKLQGSKFESLCKKFVKKSEYEFNNFIQSCISEESEADCASKQLPNNPKPIKHDLVIPMPEYINIREDLIEKLAKILVKSRQFGLYQCENKQIYSSNRATEKYISFHVSFLMAHLSFGAEYHRRVFIEKSYHQERKVYDFETSETSSILNPVVESRIEFVQNIVCTLKVILDSHAKKEKVSLLNLLVKSRTINEYLTDDSRERLHKVFLTGLIFLRLVEKLSWLVHIAPKGYTDGINPLCLLHVDSNDNLFINRELENVLPTEINPDVLVRDHGPSIHPRSHQNSSLDLASRFVQCHNFEKKCSPREYSKDDADKQADLCRNDEIQLHDNENYLNTLYNTDFIHIMNIEQAEKVIKGTYQILQLSSDLQNDPITDFLRRTVRYFSNLEFTRADYRELWRMLNENIHRTERSLEFLRGILGRSLKFTIQGSGSYNGGSEEEANFNFDAIPVSLDEAGASIRAPEMPTFVCSCTLRGDVSFFETLAEQLFDGSKNNAITDSKEIARIYLHNQEIIKRNSLLLIVDDLEPNTLQSSETIQNIVDIDYTHALLSLEKLLDNEDRSMTKYLYDVTRKSVPVDQAPDYFEISQYSPISGFYHNYLALFGKPNSVSLFEELILGKHFVYERYILHGEFSMSKDIIARTFDPERNFCRAIYVFNECFLRLINQTGIEYASKYTIKLKTVELSNHGDRELIISDLNPIQTRKALGSKITKARRIPVRLSKREKRGERNCKSMKSWIVADMDPALSKASGGCDFKPEENFDFSTQKAFQKSGMSDERVMNLHLERSFSGRSVLSVEAQKHEYEFAQYVVYQKSQNTALGFFELTKSDQSNDHTPKFPDLDDKLYKTRLLTGIGPHTQHILTGRVKPANHFESMTGLPIKANMTHSLPYNVISDHNTDNIANVHEENMGLPTGQIPELANGPRTPKKRKEPFDHLDTRPNNNVSAHSVGSGVSNSVAPRRHPRSNKKFSGESQTRTSLREPASSYSTPHHLEISGRTVHKDFSEEASFKITEKSCSSKNGGQSHVMTTNMRFSGRIPSRNQKSSANTDPIGTVGREKIQKGCSRSTVACSANETKNFHNPLLPITAENNPSERTSPQTSLQEPLDGFTVVLRQKNKRLPKRSRDVQEIYKRVVTKDLDPKTAQKTCQSANLPGNHRRDRSKQIFNQATQANALQTTFEASNIHSKMEMGTELKVLDLSEWPRITPMLPRSNVKKSRKSVDSQVKSPKITPVEVASRDERTSHPEVSIASATPLSDGNMVENNPPRDKICTVGVNIDKTNNLCFDDTHSPQSITHGVLHSDRVHHPLVYNSSLQKATKYAHNCEDLVVETVTLQSADILRKSGGTSNLNASHSQKPGFRSEAMSPQNTLSGIMSAQCSPHTLDHQEGHDRNIDFSPQKSSKDQVNDTYPQKSDRVFNRPSQEGGEHAIFSDADTRLESKGSRDVFFGLDGELQVKIQNEMIRYHGDDVYGSPSELGQCTNRNCGKNCEKATNIYELTVDGADNPTTSQCNQVRRESEEILGKETYLNEIMSFQRISNGFRIDLQPGRGVSVNISEYTTKSNSDMNETGIRITVLKGENVEALSIGDQKDVSGQVMSPIPADANNADQESGCYSTYSEISEKDVLKGSSTLPRIDSTKNLDEQTITLSPELIISDPGTQEQSPLQNSMLCTHQNVSAETYPCPIHGDRFHNPTQQPVPLYQVLVPYFGTSHPLIHGHGAVYAPVMTNIPLYYDLHSTGLPIS